MKRSAFFAGLAASLTSLLLAGLFSVLALPAGAALASSPRRGASTRAGKS